MELIHTLLKLENWSPNSIVVVGADMDTIVVSAGVVVVPTENTPSAELVANTDVPAAIKLEARTPPAVRILVELSYIRSASEISKPPDETIGKLPYVRDDIAILLEVASVTFNLLEKKIVDVDSEKSAFVEDKDDTNILVDVAFVDVEFVDTIFGRIEFSDVDVAIKYCAIILDHEVNGPVSTPPIKVEVAVLDVAEKYVPVIFPAFEILNPPASMEEDIPPKERLVKLPIVP